MGKIFQRDFLDFVPVSLPSSKKRGYKVKYIYKGVLYRSEMNLSALVRMKFSYLALSLIQLAVYFFIVSRYVPSNSSMEVVIPATASMFSMGYMCIGIIIFLFAKQELTASDFRTMNMGITWGSGVAVCAFAITVLMDLFFQLFVVGSFLWIEAAICTGYILCTMISLVIFLSWKKVKYQAIMAPKEQINVKEDFDDLSEASKNSYVNK